MNVIIIGGGYLGQLLHTLLPSARVFDWRPSAPKEPARSFGPQYLWTPIRDLPCRSFQVITHVDGAPATEASVRAYKKKVGKEQDASDWRRQFESQTVGYDVDLPTPNVEYGRRIVEINRMIKTMRMADGEVLPYDWIISTIPLPAMIGLCGMTPSAEEPFESRPIYVWTESHEPMTYLYVNYISDPNTDVYRETIRDGMKHTESLEPPGDLPDRVHRLVPGKIYRNRRAAQYRAELMMARIRTVGRYGAWDPEELAHETYAEMREWKGIVEL